MRFNSRAAALVAIAAAAIGCTTRVPKAFNRVVILIDGSLSYRARQGEAVDRAGRLLESMSQQKVHRWEKDTERIVLIALDAVPGVIWEGSLRELKGMEPAAWATRFRARADYARCTDVTSAFRLAAENLEGDARFVKKYLFAFSDMRHEPPTGGVAVCHAALSGPSAEFPWEAFRDVSASVFWMPPDQLLIWKRATQAQRLEKSFRLFSDSESGAAEILPPPRAQATQTGEERLENQGKIWSAVWLVALLVVGGFVLLVAGSVLAGRLRAARPRPATPWRPLPITVNRRQTGTAIPPRFDRPPLPTRRATRA